MTPLPPQLPPWALMWLIALALYALAKSATLAVARTPLPFTQKLTYLLLFPGMNAATFHIHHAKPPQPAAHHVLNALTGATLLWGFARTIPAQHPLVQGWFGMIGIILLLHFGILQLIFLAWQAAGYNAPLLMREPIRSTTVSEFWNTRWNTAFHQLASQFLFKPLARRTNATMAMLITFAISGLLHDLVISVPAGSGFGLPTAYFLLQGFAVLFERTRIGKSILHHRLTKRIFTIAITALPAPLLFHPPFVTRVILPFMAAIHAIPATEIHP